MGYKALAIVREPIYQDNPFDGSLCVVPNGV